MWIVLAREVTRVPQGWNYSPVTSCIRVRVVRPAVKDFALGVVRWTLWARHAARCRERLPASAFEVLGCHRIQERPELLHLSLRKRFLRRRRQVSRLLDHLFGGKDRRTRADRQRNGVRRAG